MSFTKFEDADEVVSRFIALLHANGITPAIGSNLENEFLSPLELLESTRNAGGLVGSPELIAEAGGMYDLAAKLLAIETQPEFRTFLPHLRLFEAGAEFASAVQPKTADVRDDVNRKLTELYLGALAVHFAFDVQLDHPVKSKGDNPDVMFEVRPDGFPPSTWALAIKTVSTKSGQTIFDNIAKAARQIDAPACLADRGMVVINLKNSLQNDQLWKNPFGSLAESREALQAQVDALIHAAEADRPLTDWMPVFERRTSPLVLYFAQTVVRLRLQNGSEIPTILKIAKVANPLSRQDPIAAHIAVQLNHWMQKILRGIPGADQQFPS